METALGLLGIVGFIAAIVGLAAGVTFAVIKLTPQRKPKKPESTT